MLINVPQYIDVEDKIVGPITAKQLGWLIAMGVSLLLMWNMTTRVTFFLAGIPLGMFFLALAFYKPYGQPLMSFIMYAILFLFRPKVYLWNRVPEKIPQIAHRAPSVDIGKIQEGKRLTANEMQSLAGVLDSGGAQHDPQIMELLKNAKLKK